MSHRPVMDFAQRLELGRKSEEIVGLEFERRGYHVLPCYRFTGRSGNEAPAFTCQSEALVIPDLLVSGKPAGSFWAEVKGKSAPSNGDHGIPLAHLEHYRHIHRLTQLRVFLIIHELRSGELLSMELGKIEPRLYQGRHMNHGGMAFWRREMFDAWGKVEGQS